MKLHISINDQLANKLSAKSDQMALNVNDLVKWIIAEYLTLCDKVSTNKDEVNTAISPPLAPIQLCSSMRCDDRTLYNGVLQPHTHKPSCPPLSA